MLALALVSTQADAGDDRPGWIDQLDEWHLLVALRIVVIVVVAAVLTIVLTRVARRLVRRTVDFAGRFDRDERIRLEVRQQALASALRSALVGVIWGAAAITVVSELGVNIGAFVATATIVGGAVAFGAQTLIRDVIGGFFVLAEDQYGVGDVVDVGHATGTVERITLRAVRLRDAHGRVWHVAHGNVVRIANLSKAALAVVDLEVARTTSLVDLGRVADGLVAELVADASVAPLLAGSPRAVGLVDVRDDRLVFRLAAPTKPNRDDEVTRAWRALVLARFADGRLVAPAAAAPAPAAADGPADAG